VLLLLFFLFPCLAIVNLLAFFNVRIRPPPSAPSFYIAITSLFLVKFGLPPGLETLRETIAFLVGGVHAVLLVTEKEFLQTQRSHPLIGT